MKLDARLSGIRTVELLREIFRREKVTIAPTTRDFIAPHKEATIGIGKDHLASITIDEESLEQLFLHEWADFSDKLGNQ